MDYFVPLLLIIPLIPMIAEDFKSRRIRIFWLLIFAAGVITFSLTVLGWRTALNNFLYNLLLFAYMFAGVLIWLRVKRHVESKNDNSEKISLKDAMGIGDLIFMMSITPMFDLKRYLYFIIASLSVSLVWWVLYKLLTKKATTIPLVGTSSFVFTVFTITGTL